MILTKEELSFLQLIVHENKIESKFALENITEKLYSLLSQLCHFILNETIPLTSREFNKLKAGKNIIRKLGSDECVSALSLSKNLAIVKEIAKIGIKKYEVCSKSSSGSKRRMGENQSETSERYSISSYSDEESERSESGSESGESEEEEEEEEEEESEMGSSFNESEDE